MREALLLVAGYGESTLLMLQCNPLDVAVQPADSQQKLS